MEYFIRILKANIFRQYLRILNMHRHHIIYCSFKGSLIRKAFVQKYFIKTTMIFLKRLRIAPEERLQQTTTVMVMRKELKFSGEINQRLKMLTTGSPIL